MISLIICSRRPDIPQSLKDNIAVTIGVEYELVVIENSKNQYSIFQAYNEGVRRAKFPYLCFMHEDIVYQSENWGNYVVSFFKNNLQAGALGVVGGHYLSKNPSSWFHSHVESGGTTYIVNNYGERVNNRHLTSFGKNNFTEVVVVDGLWFCIPRKLFDSLSFDEVTFNGFHCYDLDICLQIRAIKYTVNVIPNILIEHHYNGGCNQNWINDTLKFYKKWSSTLPQSAGVEISSKECDLIDLFVDDIFYWIVLTNKLQTDNENLKRSLTYKVGKFILSPVRFVKNIFK